MMNWMRVKRMATQYRAWYPDVTIKRAVHEAYVALDLYQQIDLDIYDREMEKEYERQPSI